MTYEYVPKYANEYEPLEDEALYIPHENYIIQYQMLYDEQYEKYAVFVQLTRDELKSIRDEKIKNIINEYSKYELEEEEEIFKQVLEELPEQEVEQEVEEELQELKKDISTINYIITNGTKFIVNEIRWLVPTIGLCYLFNQSQNNNRILIDFLTEKIDF